MKKRFLAVFIAGTMVLALSACGKKDEAVQQAAEVKESAAEIQEQAEEEAAEAAEETEEIMAQETEGDAPAGLYDDMPLGTYESDLRAWEITILADGTFEMLGGHGVEDPEPFTGTWEQTTIDMGDEMYADGLRFFMDGEENMVWIWDGEKFLVGPWEGEDALYEHMIRTAGPELSITGQWYAFEGAGMEIESFEFENGRWQALDGDGDVVASGTYEFGSKGQNTYVLKDKDGNYYDEAVVLKDMFGLALRFASGAAYFGSN